MRISGWNGSSTRSRARGLCTTFRSNYGFTASDDLFIVLGFSYKILIILSQSLIIWTGPLPALFTLYTSDCRCVASDTVQVKFSDGTALTRMTTRSESAHRNAVDDLDCRGDERHLDVNKTKEN